MKGEKGVRKGKKVPALERAKTVGTPA